MRRAQGRSQRHPEQIHPLKPRPLSPGLDNGRGLLYTSNEHMLITIMSRPVRQRYVASAPRVTIFKPRGVPLSHLTFNFLTVDEFEALRLADGEGDSHEEGAAKMNISRPTFGRILGRARNTVADALIHGKGLQIGGGEIVYTHHARVRCKRCRQPWDVPTAVTDSFRCPRCGQ